MDIPFYKYHGAGNDFILIDQMQERYIRTDDQRLIEQMCRRRFGIGADGLILLEKAEDVDFEMVYFNSDGKEGSLCGNGGRCAVALAYRLGVVGSECRFNAIDGLHQAKVVRPDWIELQMQDIDAVEQGQGFFFLDTGSPHYVTYVDDLDQIPVVERGRQVRYSERFREIGTNVNFVETQDDGSIRIATYERGVEDETLACGTGITASALTTFLHKQAQAAMDTVEVAVEAKGGSLLVRFRYQDGHFSDIWLCGPAELVMQGIFPAKG